MQCLLLYDIVNDAKRNKIADVCQDYGMDRIQFSAFLGKLSPNRQEELFRKVCKILGHKAGNIQLFPICAEDWGKRLVHIQEEPDAG